MAAPTAMACPTGINARCLTGKDSAGAYYLIAIPANWNGHLVPKRDPRALASAILDLLQHPQRARAMGARSIELVRREFDLNVVSDRYVEVYQQVCATHTHGDAMILPSRDERRSAALHSSMS